MSTDTGKDTKGTGADSDDCDFGGPMHPFAGAKYVKFPEGKAVIFCLTERRAMSTFWKQEGMGENTPWTKSREEGETKGWPQHDVFAAVIVDGDGFTRGRIDVKSRIRFAFRAVPVKRGTWYSLTRSGSGKQTEYAILAVPAAKVTKAMAACVEDAKAVCAVNG